MEPEANPEESQQEEGNIPNENECSGDRSRGPKLGDKIKQFEVVFTGARIDPSLPFVMRLDGHCFSKFSRGLHKPYDYNFHRAFLNTTIRLVKEFGADTGYTHSDEISLLFYPKRYS